MNTMKTTLILFLFLSSFVLSNEDLQYQKKFDSLKVLSNKFPDRAIRYAREILNQSYEGNQHPFEHKILNTLGEIYLNLGLNTEALTYLSESEAQLKILEKKAPWLKINIGNVYYQQEQYIKAREYYLDAYDIFSLWKKNQSNAISGKAVSLSNLGRIEVKIKNYDKALNYFEKALDIRREGVDYKIFLKDPKKMKKIGSVRNIARQHALISVLYNKWGQIDLALEECKVVDSLLSSISDNSKSQKDEFFLVLGNNYSQKTILYTKINQYEKALEANRSATQLLKKWPLDFVSHMKVESDFYLKQDSIYLALEALDRGIKVAMLNGFSIKEIDLLKQKLKILKDNRLERSAVDVAEKIIKKSKFFQKKRMSSLFESIEYKSELITNRQILKDLKSRQLFIYFFIGLVLVALGVSIISYRNKKKFSDQKTSLAKKEKKLIEAKLKVKENELVNMSAYIVSKNDLLGSILNDIDYHTSLIDNKNDRNILKPLQKRIQGQIDESADWDQFQMQFSGAYPLFVGRLKEDFPDLKMADIKLCCYLKMSMNTKEIARLSGLSVRAIENKRYRLRKKLGLKTDVTLEAFVSSIDS